MEKESGFTDTTFLNVNNLGPHNTFDIHRMAQIIDSEQNATNTEKDPLLLSMHPPD